MQERDVTVATLGSILGVKTDHVRQARGDRFYTFTKNLEKNRIYRDDLEKIARFFDLPLEYFILSDRDFSALKKNRLPVTFFPEKEGTYIFIHRDDHELLRPILEKVCETPPFCTKES